MATWDDVRRIALALPESSERASRGLAQWRVKDKLFLWERPLRRREIDSLGGAAPNGPILAERAGNAARALRADERGLAPLRERRRPLEEVLGAP